MEIKKLLSHANNFGSSRSFSDIKYIVYHYTANDGDTAKNNARYFANNVVKASAHYFVDDAEIYNSVPDACVAWAVGGNKWGDVAKTGGGKMFGKITNRNSISIEMCDTVRNGVVQATEKTLQNAVALGKYLMKLYNIPIENVYRHFDVTGKHCPAYFMDNNKWQEFKEKLVEEEMTYEKFCEYMDKYLSVAGTGDTPSPFAKEAAEWAKENGIINGDGSGNYGWQKPITREAAAKILHNMTHK